MNFPGDFSQLDIELAESIGLELPTLEISRASGDDLADIYKLLENNTSRFVMAWVFDLGREISSCCRATGMTRDKVRWEIERIRRTSKIRAMAGLTPK